jgi:hypothetical protein
MNIDKKLVKKVKKSLEAVKQGKVREWDSIKMEEVEFEAELNKKGAEK